MTEIVLAVPPNWVPIPIVLKWPKMPISTPLFFHHRDFRIFVIERLARRPQAKAFLKLLMILMGIKLPFQEEELMVSWYIAKPN